MKSIKYLSLVVLFLAVTVGVKAQGKSAGVSSKILFDGEQTIQLAIGPGFFSSDAGKESAFQFYNPRINVGINYLYRFKPRWGMKIGASYGWYQEEDKIWRPNRLWNAESHILDAYVLAKFYILYRSQYGRTKPSACPDLYIGLGVGVVGSKPTIKTDADARPLPIRRLAPEADISESDLIEAVEMAEQKEIVQAVKPGSTIKFGWHWAPEFPLCIGARWAVGDEGNNRFLHLGFDYMMRISTNDLLDGMNPFGSKYPDMFSSLSFSVAYVFIHDCYHCHATLSKPRFRTTKASSGYWF